MKVSKKSTKRWECSERRRYACKGSLVTDLEVKEVKQSSEHSHEPVNIEAVKGRQMVKQRSTLSHEKTSTILSQELMWSTPEVCVDLLDTDTMRRYIRRYRRGALPKEPTTEAAIDLPHEFTATGGEYPERFLIYDNKGSELHGRILIYTTDCGLRQLCRANHWFMDGAFKSCRRLF